MRTSETNEVVDEEMEKLFVSGDGAEELVEGDDPNDPVLIHNAGDAEQVQKGEIRLEQRERQDRSDLLWLLSDVRGRRFLWKLLEKTRPFVSGYQPDNNALQFFSGQRDIGKDVFLEIMDADVSAFGKMMTEFKGETNGSRKRKRRN